jgi:hypothetical protein
VRKLGPRRQRVDRSDKTTVLHLDTGEYESNVIARRNCQYLWIGEFQATSVPVFWTSVVDAAGVMSIGSSSTSRSSMILATAF